MMRMTTPTMPKIGERISLNCGKKATDLIIKEVIYGQNLLSENGITLVVSLGFEK